MWYSPPKNIDFGKTHTRIVEHDFSIFMELFMSDYFPTVRFRLDLQHTYNITYMYIYYTLYVYNLKIIRYIYIQYTHTHIYIICIYCFLYCCIFSITYSSCWYCCIYSGALRGEERWHRSLYGLCSWRFWNNKIGLKYLKYLKLISLLSMEVWDKHRPTTWHMSPWLRGNDVNTMT